MDVSFYQSAKNLEQPFSDFCPALVKSAFIAFQPVASANLLGTGKCKLSESPPQQQP